jgi:hypothetical protein
MRNLILTSLLFASSVALAQEQSENIKNLPSTKLEAFSARTGIVMIKGFSTVGVVNGMGKVSVDAREFRDASNPKSAQYGVAFEVKESGRLERENTSFIDEDEIDSLIRGLDYISKIQKTVTTLDNFEAQYRTKGDLSFTVFSGGRGEISLAVSSGRIGKTTAFLKLADAEQIRSLLADAKKSITSAKSSGK